MAGFFSFKVVEDHINPSAYGLHMILPRQVIHLFGIAFTFKFQSRFEVPSTIDLVLLQLRTKLLPTAHELTAVTS